MKNYEKELFEHIWKFNMWERDDWVNLRETLNIKHMTKKEKDIDTLCTESIGYITTNLVYAYLLKSEHKYDHKGKKQ